MITSMESGVIAIGAIQGAMGFAGLEASALKTGAHPDNGQDCLHLEADIQQYSAFLTALAVQYRTADRLTFLVDQVQLQYDGKGDTRFWLPGVEVPGQ